MRHISTSKKIILSVLGILLILSLLVGISYAYYMVSVSQSNKNVVKSSCLNLSISNEENVIKLEKQIPIMNEEGKKLTPYTFTINNTCNSMMAYSLNLEELEGSTLASKYIMTMVNDKNYVNMASLSSTDNYYSNSVESRVLATGSLGPNASINYSLRLWMDEDTPLTTDAMNKSFRSKVVVVATPTKTVDFDYTGTEQTFVAPVSGTYRLETWGAQGGKNLNSLLDSNGNGGYSSGIIKLKSLQKLIVNIGGVGNDATTNVGGKGGYNGGGKGGNAAATNLYGGGGSGGGATHIATKSGLLNELENFKDDILIVSGGGGGTTGGRNPVDKYYGGSGGGLSGGYSQKISTSPGAISSSATNLNYFSFGKGQDGIDSIEGSYGAEGNGGGGGGYYAGFSNQSVGTNSNAGGGGGSGYIGNSLLKDKAMYCYNCEESNEESAKTISTTCAEETPTANCAKKGNGYARITYIG